MPSCGLLVRFIQSLSNYTETHKAFWTPIFMVVVVARTLGKQQATKLQKYDSVRKLVGQTSTLSLI